ncbi:MAG TPA: hypothetical protein V6D05_09890 [Stenomitos sp.]
MIRTPAATFATSALVALSLGLLGACALQPAGPFGVTPQVQPAAPGGMVVPVQLPKLSDRTAQYAYQNGYINTLEVMVVDSLGRHQAFLVCRNPQAVGMPGGKVNLLFQDVAPGTAWVTVRTTFKQFIGTGKRLEPVDGEPSTFALDGGNPHVTAVVGDLSSSVLVFKSTDLGATEMAPSVLSFYQNNNGNSELNDTSSVYAGYGVGAATGSVVPGTTATVSLTVAQPPSFGSDLLNTTRQVDAGGAVTVSAANVNAAIDRVVVVRADDPAATSDFIDLTKTNSYDFYPVTDNLDGTVTFTPTRSTDVPVKYYLARGEMVSLIGASGSDVDLAKLQIHPAAVDSTKCTIRIGSDDGSAAFPRRAGETDTIRITLRDQFYNLITAGDFGARSMEGYLWRPSVEPTFTVLNNNSVTAPNPLAFIPGSTIGTLTTPTYDVGTKTWVSTFTQGATPPTTKGASASFAVAANTNIEAVTYLYDPSNTGDTTYTLGVVDYPPTARRLAVSLYRGTAVDPDKFVASASYTPPVTPLTTGATISFAFTAPSGLPTSILRVGTKANTDLTTADDGTRLIPTLGARTAPGTPLGTADKDRVVFRIYRQNADGSLTATGQLTAGPYLWKQ